jgi:hypothetical protein
MSHKPDIPEHDLDKLENNNWQQYISTAKKLLAGDRQSLVGYLE